MTIISHEGGPSVLHAQLAAFVLTHAHELQRLGCWPIQEARQEVISPEFCKWHLGEIRPGFWPVLHHFTAPDQGGPHDHPRGFISHVLAGGYVERIYTQGPLCWQSAEVFRAPGTAHYVAANHVHRVLSLPRGDCWTLVFAGPVEQEWRFYEVGDAA